MEGHGSALQRPIPLARLPLELEQVLEVRVVKLEWLRASQIRERVNGTRRPSVAIGGRPTANHGHQRKSAAVRIAAIDGTSAPVAP